jgi:hypothetical protein
VTGNVRWAQDRYGSRFAVIAPFTAGWYLWDVDACTFRAFTVHSGYYDSPGPTPPGPRGGASSGRLPDPGDRVIHPSIVSP